LPDVSAAEDRLQTLHTHLQVPASDRSVPPRAVRASLRDLRSDARGALQVLASHACAFVGQNQTKQSQSHVSQ